MINVLIVDDEERTREGLIRHFNWRDYDARVIAQAGDGKEALDMVEKYRPEIILCDVKMARMDGITFARQLYQKKCKSKIIFISGYDNISYIRSALKLNAIDYILKPINFDDLKEAFESVVEKINAERQAESQRKREQNLICTLIMGRIFEDDRENSDYQKRLNCLELDSCERYVITKWQPEGYESEYKDKKDLSALFYSVQNVLTEILEQYFDGYVVCLDNKDIISIMGIKEEKLSNLFETFEYAQKMIFETLGIDIKYVNSDAFDRLFELRQEYINLCAKCNGQNEKIYVIKQIKDYIEQHYNEKFTIPDIADAVYMNNTYICLMFKKETGITINQYITQVRMEKALQILKNGRYKLNEVSDMVGYSDPNYFNKLLKKHCGRSFKDFKSKG